MNTRLITQCCQHCAPPFIDKKLSTYTCCSCCVLVKFKDSVILQSILVNVSTLSFMNFMNLFFDFFFKIYGIPVCVLLYVNFGRWSCTLFEV